MRRGQRYYYFASFFFDPEELRSIRSQSAQALAGLDRFFWSGVPDATELAAASSSGPSVGVGVTALTRASATPIGPGLEAEVLRLLPSKLLFVDSGAYGAENAGLDLDNLKVRGMPAWDFVFQTYHRLAKGRPKGQTFVVAPDVKGSQEGTLRRLRTHRHSVKALQRNARVLVPLQPGRLSLVEQAREVDQLLGDQWVPAFALAAPGSLSYYTPAMLGDFVRRRRPALVHLLGAGPATRGSRADRVVPHLRESASRAGVPLLVQADSALTRGITRSIRAFREKLKKRHPIDQIAPFELTPGQWRLPGGMAFDETEDWALPFDDLPASRLKKISRMLLIDPSQSGPSVLTAQERRSFRNAPSSFLLAPPRALLNDPALDAIARELLYRWVYREFIDSLGASQVRAAAIRSAGLERIQGAPLAPDPTLGLITCGKSKSGPAPARELYTGCLFRDARGYFEDRKTPYFILSARHGLVEPSERLEEYDEQLPSTRSKRAAWAQKVVGQLERRLGTLRGRSIEFHGGKKYLDPLSDMLRRQGARVTTPVQGKTTGSLRAFYKEHRL